MHTPLLIRLLTADERATLQAGLRSAEAFTVRRCQMLLASAEGQHSTTMARNLRCHAQTVRNALHAFHQRGMRTLQPTSSRHHRPKAVCETQRRVVLCDLVTQSPPQYTHADSI